MEATAPIREKLSKDMEELHKQLEPKREELRQVLEKHFQEYRDELKPFLEDYLIKQREHMEEVRTKLEPVVKSLKEKIGPNWDETKSKLMPILELVREKLTALLEDLKIQLEPYIQEYKDQMEKGAAGVPQEREFWRTEEKDGRVGRGGEASLYGYCRSRPKGSEQGVKQPFFTPSLHLATSAEYQHLEPSLPGRLFSEHN